MGVYSEKRGHLSLSCNLINICVRKLRYLCAANMPRPRSVSIIMKSLQQDIFVLYFTTGCLNLLFMP